MKNEYILIVLVLITVGLSLVLWKYPQSGSNSSMLFSDGYDGYDVPPINLAKSIQKRIDILKRELAHLPKGPDRDAKQKKLDELTAKLKSL